MKKSQKLYDNIFGILKFFIILDSLNTHLYIKATIHMMLSMRYWNMEVLPLGSLLDESWEILNEEAGEIALSMLSSIQNRADVAKVQRCNEQWHETMLRFKTGIKWNDHFNIETKHYHYNIHPTDEHIILVQNFFIESFQNIRSNYNRKSCKTWRGGYKISSLKKQ